MLSPGSASGGAVFAPADSRRAGIIPRAQMNHDYPVETLGMAAAALTTLCWVPQAIRILRTRDTRSISLAAQAAFAAGVALWLAYGLLIGSWPVILANAVTLVLALAILAMKVRYK